MLNVMNVIDGYKKPISNFKHTHNVFKTQKTVCKLRGSDPYIVFYFYDPYLGFASKHRFVFIRVNTVTALNQQQFINSKFYFKLL